MTNFNLISEAIAAINANDKDTAIARLKAFTSLNTPKPKAFGKVNIWNWTDPKEYRTFCHGVFHDPDNGVAVATDTHVILTSKIDYDSERAGEIHTKSGDKVKAVYPAYRRIFRKNNVTFEVNRERIAECLSKAKSERKLDKRVEYKAFNIGTGDKPFYLTPENCKLLLTLPEGEFLVAPGERFDNYAIRPLQYKSNDGNLEAIIMPIYITDQYIGQLMVKAML